ncbi:MAG: hypothetical protein AAGK04_09450 [Planctomycetota bacterium]
MRWSPLPRWSPSAGLSLVGACVAAVAFAWTLLSAPVEMPAEEAYRARAISAGFRARVEKAFIQDRMDRVLTLSDEVIEHNPQHRSAWMFRGIALERLGMDRGARLAWVRLLQLTEPSDASSPFWGFQPNPIGPDVEGDLALGASSGPPSAGGESEALPPRLESGDIDRLYVRAWAQRGLGQTEAARRSFTRIADQLVEWTERAGPRARPGVIRAYNLACYRSMAGDTDRALDRLTESINAGYDELEWLEVDPDLDPLRDDPRYLELLESAHAALESGSAS